MTFPLRHTVIHRPYIGFEVDELHNEVPAWDDPQPVRVISWRPKTTQSYSGDRRTRGMWQSRQITELMLTYPPGLEVNVRDVFTMPDGHDYEVDEITNLCHGPFWPAPGPGNKATLKRIEPTGKPVAPQA